EKLAELDRAVTAVQPAHDFSRLRVQGREQRGGVVAEVIVAPPLRLAETHRQHRLAASSRPRTAPAPAPADPDTNPTMSRTFSTNCGSRKAALRIRCHKQD